MLADITETQFHWLPGGGEWSIDECFDHLVVVNQQLLPYLDRAIEQARSKQWFSQGPFHYGALDTWFVTIMDRPTSMQAPAIYLPRSQRPMQTVVTEFMSLQDALMERVQSANGLDLVRTKMSSPVSTLLRFSLGIWLAAIPAHERQHLAQAHQVMEHPNFPTAA